ncbi:cobalamin biosynthesis protein [Priestia megaterium]|uniref:GTP-binding protein n=1 Tax=Priestia megaterium TaxID=1404 RepID=UPI00094D79C2|nr:GTP-binding protein [Priestia megaterium]MBY0201416.1 cobalamin biosynthesis protein [Priestia megaterium]OLO27515.1 cobalamin biosynthesis protein [Priestia megaterium]
MKTAKLVLLGGFLGAGKTTTMINSALKLEEQGYRVAIVTNDQGKELIDTELARKNGLDTKEVTGGCFCCQFEDLYENLTGLLEEKQPDVIIAEAVGSCTDLAATVIQPLKQYYSEQFKTAPLTIVVDPARLMHELNATDETRPSFSQSVSYIFEKQLAEADIITLNKLDRYSSEEIEKLYNYLQQRYPQTVIQTISAERGDNLDLLTETWLTTDLGGDKVLDIDYERYAEGEAQLAWMNILGDLSSDQDVDPRQWATNFLDRLNAHFVREKMAIAHLKVHVGLENGYVKASMVHTGDEPTFTEENVHDAKQLRVVLNIRIEASPAILNLVVADAIGALNQEFGTKWTETYNECFSPLPPKPVHRLYEVL